ncbi:MAG: GGDEF domain-containing protein [Treponema sp.]|jgi:diguanylate cyclase (GGDEF)-like protein|nr:GGDEF domain-containing protein [Treponema sp.]
MHLTETINAIFGSGLTLVLIFINYIRKFNTDTFQRSIFLRILGFSFIALSCDIIFFLFNGYRGKEAFYLLYITLSVYYIFQVLSFFYTFIFVDFTAHKDVQRTKKIMLAAWIVAIVHIVILLLNLRFRFYFYISPDNYFFHGDKYFIRMILGYSPAVLAIGDAILSFKRFKKNQFYLIVSFFFLTGAGSTIDILMGTGSFVWPCFSAAMLYTYFFIIKSDSRIDSLTGIGNRYSFNEFIDRLSRQSVRGLNQDPYAIVMIDMDRFKEINDTLGHLEGDNALKDMSAIIKGCIRHSDFAARYGGDEFVLATRAKNNIEKLMARIQQAIDAQNEKQIRPYRIEMSYGHDVFIAGGDRSIQEFLTHIDSLMYKQKTERRRSSYKRGQKK